MLRALRPGLPNYMKEKVIIALTTCPESAGPALADALVAERLAACVNQITGVESTYIWQGAITREREALLVIKTTAARYEDLAARIQALHPYEVPELIVLPVEAGLEAYLAWVRDTTGPGTD